MPPLVLLVDDEETLRMMQARYLRRHGFDVREAATGPEALRAARNEPLPDVIVMDIMLPGMDGVRVTIALREAQATQGIPVIASTGAVLRDLPMADAGFTEVLHKPYDLKVLLTALQAALAGFRASSAN